MTARRLLGALALVGCLSLQPASAQGVLPPVADSVLYTVMARDVGRSADSLAARFKHFTVTRLRVESAVFQVSGLSDLPDSLAAACGVPKGTPQSLCPGNPWLLGYQPAHVVELRPDTGREAASSPMAADCTLPSWAQCDVGIAAAWAAGLTGYGVQYSNLDTGAGPNVNNFGSRLLGGHYATTASTDWSDDNGDCDSHGTWTMSAMISAAYGMAPEGTGWAERVFPVTGSCLSYDSWQIAGLQDAQAHHSEVVSVSIGGTTPNLLYQFAINTAVDTGMIFCSAAGNNGGPLTYPGADTGNVTVAAIDQGGVHPSWSDTGQQVRISAPGVGLPGDGPNNAENVKSGTSMATPITCAIAGLFKGIAPHFHQDTILALLRASADPLGNPSVFGAGRVRADKAWALLASTGFPTVSQPPIACQGTCSGCVSVSGTQPFQSLPTRSWVTTVDSVPQRKICYTANTALAAPGDSARVVVQGLGS